MCRDINLFGFSFGVCFCFTGSGCFGSFLQLCFVVCVCFCGLLRVFLVLAVSFFFSSQPCLAVCVCLFLWSCVSVLGSWLCGFSTQCVFIQFGFALIKGSTFVFGQLMTDIDEEL